MDIVKFFSVWGVADKTFVIGREIKSFLAVQVSRVQIFLNRIVCPETGLYLRTPLLMEIRSNSSLSQRFI